MNYIDQACIITKVTKNQFIDNLLTDEFARWRYEDAEALYEYYVDVSLDQGAPIELDRVALRCEWTVADNIEEVVEDYDSIEDLEDLNQHTTVIEHDDGSLLFKAF